MIPQSFPGGHYAGPAPALRRHQSTPCTEEMTRRPPVIAAQAAIQTPPASPSFPRKRESTPSPPGEGWGESRPDGASPPASARCSGEQVAQRRLRSREAESEAQVQQPLRHLALTVEEQGG